MPDRVHCRAIMQVASSPKPAPSSIRRRGLFLAGGSAAAVLLMWIITAVQIHFVGHASLPGAVFVLPPIIAAFGFTQLVTGRDSGWWQLPVVVLFAVVGIGLTFYFLVPHGYDVHDSSSASP